MAVQGPFTMFNAAKIKILDPAGPIGLGVDTFKAVLCTSSQALAANFTGGSGNCQYSDLTNELATASGYTSGGATLGSVTLASGGSGVVWDSDDIAWTLTGSITFKYLVTYDDTTPNKDLVCFANMDTGGGSVSPLSGPLIFTINPAIGTLT